MCIALIVSFDAMVRPSIACGLGSFGCSFVRLLDLNLIDCNSCGVACTSIGIATVRSIYAYIYIHTNTRLCEDIYILGSVFSVDLTIVYLRLFFCVVENVLVQ